MKCWAMSYGTSQAFCMPRRLKGRYEGDYENGLFFCGTRDEMHPHRDRGGSWVMFGA